jgi:hypothetical protein
MLEFISTHAAISGFIFGLWIIGSLMAFRAINRHKRTVMSLSAAEFRDLAIIKRNTQLKKGLSKAYSEIKSRVFGVTVDGRYRLLFSLDRWYRKHRDLTQEEFGELFGKPLTERLKKEGFTVDYMPSGAVEPKRHKADPALDIRWRSVEPESEQETEIKTKNSWN